MSNKILVTTSSFNKYIKEIEHLEERGFEIMLNPYNRRLTEEEVGQLLKENEIVGMIAGVEPLTKSVLEGATNLKVISRCGIGMDSVDVDSAKQLGVEVFNTPDAPTIAVAELALSMMLNLLRKVSLTDRRIREGNWKSEMGNLLSAQTVGIIGYGRIGRKVANLVQAFGAKVICYDVFDFAPEGDAIRVESLNDLFNNSDIVTLHVPYMESTHHIIDQEAINNMKESSIIINVSRGGLIDEDALYHAIKSEKIAGAGLDAFEIEPYNGPLKELEQTLLTAHMGSYAKEARMEQERLAAENLIKGIDQFYEVGKDKNTEKEVVSL
ncbi:phosphoglycerate dehydrogenase [Metabacillus halosaccharovorans]|uniref:phosphoglycerate dehydrogenase n=1 Tax=Metabacillus halosaccharovorans TaxID=930124 RepID=UPI0034CDB242